MHENQSPLRVCKTLTLFAKITIRSNTIIIKHVRVVRRSLIVVCPAKRSEQRSRNFAHICSLVVVKGAAPKERSGLGHPRYEGASAFREWTALAVHELARTLKTHVTHDVTHNMMHDIGSV